MSYDIHVYAARTLSIDDLRGLVVAAGLTLEGDASGAEDASAPEALTVLRGARGRYCFTLGTSQPIEAEDVPEQVVAVTLTPTHLYEFGVEGSSDTEVPHAIRFAKRLAAATAGVVFDQQTEQTWHRGKLRASNPVERGRTDVVNLHWYTDEDGNDGSAARAWLAAARMHLPEALPRRFGGVEPLAMRLDRDGPAALEQSVADEDESVYFTSTAPCIGGSLAGGAGTKHIRSHGLTVHRGPLAAPAWREALQRFFVNFAVSSGSFFACAEVERGVGWSGRSLWYDSNVERTSYLAGGGHWAGLPPYPVWWSWFGPAYVPLVVDHLPREQMKQAGGGLLCDKGQQPLDRDQLVAALGGPAKEPGSLRRLLSAWNGANGASAEEGARRWLPSDLQPRVDTSDPNVYIYPLEPAVQMPSFLRAGD